MPTTNKILLARAALSRSKIADRKAIIPKYKNNKINSEVKRASHTHQVPHMGFPHKEPVTKARKVDHAPKGALAEILILGIFFRQITCIVAATAIIPYTNKDRNELGT